MTDRESMSPVKLGIAVLWPAFWTGLPIKLALALLFFAMGTMHLEAKAGLALIVLLASPVTVGAFFVLWLGMDVHLGEGAGLVFLFLLSIPIDMWALGVVGRTLFLERLRVEPPVSLGLTLWWKCALAGAIYVPLLWLAERTVTDIAQSVVHSILEIDFMKELPVAERISLELTLWGSVSTVVLILLVMIGFSLIGRLVRNLIQGASPTTETYQGLISRWDLMRVPQDQGLMLAAFTGAGVVLGVLFWFFLPVSTPHPHECCMPQEMKTETTLRPLESLNKSEKLLKAAELKVSGLEKKPGEEGEKDKEKGKEKDKEK
ncbi:MAG TPA: hypothetical protein VJ805_14730, partial [Nitrospiraceae bacterium]|nr:hypothetical protein [Nitrospiraceae bacterium]